MQGGFWNDDHSAAFAAGRARTSRGRPDAAICGARTRGGTICQSLPIREGKGRCLKHAGPHAARLFRYRQRQNFLAGHVSAEDWQRAEARRAANRLGRDWKRNPWAQGQTIDLGHAEAALRRDVTESGWTWPRWHRRWPTGYAGNTAEHRSTGPIHVPGSAHCVRRCPSGLHRLGRARCQYRMTRNQRPPATRRFPACVYRDGRSLRKGAP